MPPCCRIIIREVSDLLDVDPSEPFRPLGDALLCADPFTVVLQSPVSLSTTSLLMPEGFAEHAGTTPEPGWYVVCEPLEDPLLVRVERLMGPRWRVDGVNLDTGEPVENADVLFVLGPADADVAPFVTDHAAGRAPWEHHRMSAGAAPAST